MCIVVFVLYMVMVYWYWWMSKFVEEVVNLVFYIYMGYKFRLVVYNLYFVLDDEEEEVVVLEVLKDDEFDL